MRDYRKAELMKNKRLFISHTNGSNILGRSPDAGNMGKDFAMPAFIVLIALIIQLCFLRPEVDDIVD